MVAIIQRCIAYRNTLNTMASHIGAQVMRAGKVLILISGGCLLLAGLEALAVIISRDGWAGFNLLMTFRGSTYVVCALFFTAGLILERLDTIISQADKHNFQATVVKHRETKLFAEPAPPEPDREQTARELLAKAKEQHSRGDKEAAKDTLSFLAREFRDTTAGQRAGELLGQRPMA